MSHRQHSLVIRYTNGHEDRIVLPDQVDEVKGHASLAEWIDTNMALVEVDDRTLLLLEQEDRVLTIPFRDIKNIEYAPRASKLTH
jgi:hypothetical protein